MKIEKLSAGEQERLRAIRLRSLQDAPDAFSTTLAEAASRGAEDWRRQLAELATFVATIEGEDVGIVRAAPHDELDDVGYLISMWVARRARRRGVACGLIDALVHWARDQRWKRLLLDVGEQNAPAIALYRRMGFTPNGVVSTLPPPRQQVREVQMVLVLDSARSG
ncbi:MAG: GNAT family N-acetyltransferase [Pirellulaceae bacterium]